MPRGWLLALLALALAARLPGLSRSLWYDELFTLVHFAGSPRDALARQVEANNHPLASLLAWAAGQLAADEAGLRAPFLVLGALAVPALAWAAARALGPAAGVAAGALAALAPAHVAYAQQVRGYAPLLLAATLLLHLVPRALRGDASRREEAALAACVALGLWAHATLLLPLAGWAALALAAPRLGLAPPAGRAAALRGVVAGALGGLLLLAPTVDDLWKHARRALRPVDRALAGPFDPGRLSPVDLLDVAGGDGAASSVAGALLALLVLLLALRGALARRRSPAVVAWCVPPLMALLLVALGAPAFPRLALFALPALLALAAAGVVASPRRVTRAALVALVVALATLRASAQAGAEQQDVRGAVRLARGLVGPDGVVVGAGVGGGLARVYDPALVADETWSRAASLLDDGPRPLAVVVLFPAWTPAAQRRRLAQGDGALLSPGRVTHVAVWLAH
ncbi:MAG: hypothetical protein M9894_07455 [Planctomycetes bacterium]|nr:hypothetical protein [Planctomycetota bacterium]